MSGSNVQPLRTSQVDDGTHAPVLTRLITPPPGMSDAEAYAMERKVHLVLLIENIFKLSAQVARLLVEKAGQVDDFCGAVFDKDDESPDVVVHVAPRDIAIESLGDGPWGRETRERLAKPFLPDRLDVIVESKMMLVLASVEVFPALPGDAGAGRVDEPAGAAAVRRRARRSCRWARRRSTTRRCSTRSRRTTSWSRTAWKSSSPRR